MTVKVSSKFQVVIPLEVRKALKIKPGMKFEVIPYANHIELVPEIDIKKAKGFLRGMNTDFVREDDRI